MIETKEKDLKKCYTYDIDLLIQRKKDQSLQNPVLMTKNIIKGIRHNEVELVY